MSDDLDLLIQSYRLFENELSGNGKLEINRKIKSRVEYLDKSHGLDRDYLANWLYERYASSKLYLKYDPERSSLVTFIGHYVNNALMDLIRRYDALKRNFQEEVPPYYSSNDYPHHGWGCSLEDLERKGIDAAIDWDTPEDHLLAKELAGLVKGFFEPSELMILLGYKDRLAEAKKSDVEYHIFCKRLWRKREAFKAVLREAGYL